MTYTTLNAIRNGNPCADGWAKLLRHLGKTEADDEPLPLREILDSNGLDDALWCLRVMPHLDREARLFAAWCARQVQHLMTDPRSIAALDVAERYANGKATDAELIEARDAANAAARDAPNAAANAAARAAGWDTARDAPNAAANAAANATARAAEWAAARAAARAAQEARFVELFCTEEPKP